MLLSLLQVFTMSLNAPLLTAAALQADDETDETLWSGQRSEQEEPRELAPVRLSLSIRLSSFAFSSLLFSDQ